ncbi:uncharacterized protein N7515_001209 [Penicillium bovifimosum]|uniref:Uncharacterized protein n=1 Tax=Penicillium bovifimosum TaxID=126998 RepID=A0A9W9HGS7_9EURO|nr:uncharacterized protein N7515_001209 [Penicillium bovifimosum]KAJ5146645.1 hypothetical protein N7515_001209 [Penicillium bovifimosum]
MSQLERDSIKRIVERARYGLQGLLKAAVASQEIRRTPSRSRSSVALNNEQMDGHRHPAEITTKKGITNERKQRRPNMDIGIHYAGDTDIDHKELVRSMNGVEVERTLLLEESFRRTLRFYVEGSFSHDDQRTTLTIQQAAQRCPLVFASLFHMPVSDLGLHIGGSTSPTEDQDQAHDMTDSELYSEIKVPIPSGPNDPFVKELRGAYREEYSRPHVTTPGKYAPHWYKKVSFFHGGTKQRYTLSVGDYVEYRSQGIGQVLGFFTHELIPRERRVFVHLQPLSHLSRDDSILLLPQFKPQHQTQLVVGLTGISYRKKYVLNTAKSQRHSPELSAQQNEDGTDELDVTLTYCTWNVEFF